METMPWIEKYRPQNLNNVISHESIINTLKKFIKNKKLPHLLLHGPPGTGKTSVITACAKELYGVNYNMMVIEINASEERGIEVVRNRITRFASMRSFCFDDNMFKLIILDEADAMTADAQASLRRVIEKYTYNVRFCLICNYIKKINTAIQSRCVCIRFAPIKEIYIKDKMNEIIEKEKINITEQGINTIIKRSRGDMRRVLNLLQSTSMTRDAMDTLNKITEENINECLGYPKSSDITKLFNCMVNKSFLESYVLLKTFKEIQGYSLNDIINEIHAILIDIVVKNTKCNLSIDKIKNIIGNLRDIEHNLANCTSDNLHMGEFIGLFYCAK